MLSQAHRPQTTGAALSPPSSALASHDPASVCSVTGVAPKFASDGLIGVDVPPADALGRMVDPAARAALHVLVVDDDAHIRGACAEIAVGLGFVTEVADSVSSARLALSKGSIDVILLDLKLPGGGGLSLLEEIHTRDSQTVVVVMTAFATVGSAVEAMRIGAGDYLTKPFTLKELSATLERAAYRRSFDLESRLLSDNLRHENGIGEFVGRSPVMEKLYRMLSKVAHATHPVLILGEPGTGKDLVARSIHNHGLHANKPFISVDCGSLVPHFTESELFGHMKGAFPGADRAKTGLLNSVKGGTVFLDEIGELPLDLQGRLLHALQEKEVCPAGGTHAQPLDARILAGTKHDLGRMVETGRFRKDLFFRLNVVNLCIPPLRERVADIPLQVAHVLANLFRENGRTYTLANDVLQMLISYDWPGNVRELENAIERACTLSSGQKLQIGDFPAQLQKHIYHGSFQTDFSHPDDKDPATGPDSAGVLTKVHSHVFLSMATLEKDAILNTIHQLKGDKIMAARLLGIGKTTLYRKLKGYGLGVDQSLTESI